MSNFEWENIEKKAGRKKYISLVIIFLAVSLFIVYYKNVILVESDKEVIKERLLKEQVSKSQKIEEKDLYDMLYTVKIGRFLDFDLARDFIIKNNIKVFNIYKEDQDIYVNLGPIDDFEKVQNIKDDFIRNGYPAIVELFEKREEVVNTIDSNLKEKTSEKNLNPIKSDNIKKTDKIIKTEKTIKPEKTEISKVNEDGVYISDPLNLKSGFTIQVAAFRELTDANMTKNKLRFSGINPVIIKESGYFKVQIGLFETKIEAEDYVKKFDKSVIPDFYIKKVQR
ncbi:MAG: SPOR domain-containing protein [Candidatus Muirbacterium halophilum]|nr:SPOR domain-containing protein [Candidatus Muirbacterium halophilum]MCK9475973.1 SPOR domain-containing protein [Candidatus Muirbacterium halophilum]